MIVLRGLAFLFFVLLAAAMMLWQGNHLVGDLATAWSSTGTLVLMALGAGILLAEALAWRAMAKNPPMTVLAITGAPLLPVSSIIAGGVSLLQARSGDHRRIWTTSFGINTLLTVNVLVPLIAGTIFIGGSPGLMAGWSAIKFQFFLVVDYFLFRAILHYFSSGASAFVSLRFLRKRVMSLLAVVGIMLGVLVLILVNSVMSGFQTDFREQMRGSLSHILVRFRSEDIHMRLRGEQLAQAEWAEYVRRIQANPDMALPWEAALENALILWRESDKDGLPDPREYAHAQPPIEGDGDEPKPGEPTTTGLSADEKALIERLRTGAGLTDFDRECLRDDGKIVTPAEFYLSRVGDPDKEAEEIRLTWYTPIFRAALQEQFDNAEAALSEHTNVQGERDIEGVSWRVSTKTFITPKSGSRELPIAELVGVDIEREPTISRLGEYVADAELADFRNQYALGPLLNILGATLGWETEESLAATDGQRDFMFTEDGKDIGRLPSDMTRTLAMRRFTTASGRVRWREFDNVRYLEFSPGRAIYERVREAYKEASRTDDMRVLGEVLKSCEQDVRKILIEHMRDNPEGRFAQVNNTGAGIIFNEYLTGLGDSVDAIRIFYGDNYTLLKEFTSNPEGSGASAADVELANNVWEQLNAATKETEQAVKRRDVTEAEREQALFALGEKYLKIYDAGIEQARKDKLASALDLLQNLRAAASNPEDLLPLTKRMGLRMKVPLSYAAEFFDSQAEAVQARMQAYRKVLPLRTSMAAGETTDEYFKRARTAGMRPEEGMPGIILGDALAESALGAGVNVGDSIAVTIPRIYYEDNRLTPRTTEVWFRVTGFFRSGLYEENRGRMYCDFEEMTKLLADSEVRYVVGAKLKDYRPYEGQLESDKLKSDLRALLSKHGARYQSVGVWEDETRTLLEAVNIERTLIGLIVSFIIVLAGGAIVIIVYQLVNEKVRDIGILKALGHSPWGIRSVFMFNALFIGLFGAILGCGAGMIFSEYLNEIEDFIDEATGIRLFPPDVYFLTYIPSVKGWALLQLAVDIAMPVVMFGFFCGILPSMAAARKDPVEALHYE
jgi:ABC-type lipoprotein release transport system permease subunit